MLLSVFFKPVWVWGPADQIARAATRGINREKFIDFALLALME
jgi:hypothetical protein